APSEPLTFPLPDALPIFALNIFLASKSFGKDRSQQIVSAHALDPWRNFLPPRNRSKASARPASRRAVKSGEASTACSRTVRTERSEEHTSELQSPDHVVC